MQMTDSQRIPASRDKVWAALNDPVILQRCIPGCDSLEMTSPTEMSAKVTLKVGPVKASFGGKVTLSEIDAPNGYRITGEGSGGVAGFAKGGALISLKEDGPDATILTYEADAQIGGKLAQLGSRLIDSTARKLAGDFFTSFAAALGPVAAETVPAEAAPVADGEAVEPEAKKGWFKNLFGKSDVVVPVLALLALSLGAVHFCCLGPAHAEMDFPICSAAQAS
ncbi:MAG: carbon monoxide dehydrogenase subunit G [Rhodospirillaceae bacterium]|nr:carbon monoxide dehydrogenase subunit G [Rhodospirillaceae bacterium]